MMMNDSAMLLRPLLRLALIAFAVGFSACLALNLATGEARRDAWLRAAGQAALMAGAGPVAPDPA